MLEKHRLTYLEHLGIENYVPKVVLSHAATSSLLPDEALLEPSAFSTADIVDSADSLNVDVSSTSNISPNQDSSSDVSSNDVIADILGTHSHENVDLSVADEKLNREKTGEPLSSLVNPQEKIASPSAIAESVKADDKGLVSVNINPIRFSLHVWRINNDLLVIDTHQPGAALPTDRLLQNILRSIGIHLAQLPASDTVRWPLFKGDPSANEEEEARAMVQAYISAQCGKMPVKTIMLLGKDAIRFSLNTDSDIETFYQQHQGSSLPQSVWNNSALIAPSLIDMLQDPMQKKVTWQALKTLMVAPS